MQKITIRAALFATTMLCGTTPVFAQDATTPVGAPANAQGTTTQAPTAVGETPAGQAVTAAAAPNTQSSATQAQTVAATAPGTENSADIVVTGTRITTNGFSAPTPVSVVTEAQIQRAAPATVADFVNQLPALSGSDTPRTTRGNLAAGNAGANFLNLRNLGAPRTLVLLNGRRVTPSNLTGATDVNILPQGLISRVDVVTGGASAAWGSDAVAGVVNFVLNTNFTGLRGSIQSGTSIEGDAGQVSGDLSFGTRFADGRGHFIVSGQYSRTEAAFANTRDWFRAYKIYANPAFAAGNGQPARIVVPYSSIIATDNGLIASGPLRGTFFDANGQVAGTNFQFPPIISGIYGGGSQAVYNTLADQSRNDQINTPVEQYSLYSRASYDLFDHITAFVEGSYAHSHSDATIANYFRTGNTSLAIDNFYLPQSVRTAMGLAGVTSVPLSTGNAKLGVLRSQVTRENYRILGGIEGRIAPGWNFGLSYQYGQTDVALRSPNNIIPARYALAIDAVANPANPSQVICRSTIANPANGCIPINPLGSQPLTAAQAGYVLGNSIQDLTYRQTVLSGNIDGELFQLPGGPLSLAAGAEYRTERASATSDALSQANGYYAGNYKPFNGRYNVKEVYAELGIPLFRNSSLGHSLSLNLAGRLTDYSTSGTVTTWKAGATYAPIEDIELRITRSRDIRAPNLNELFLGGIVQTSNVSDPANGGANAQFLLTTRGNLALQPERANTLTGGVVLRPRFLPGFGLSIDYYNIEIGDAIATNSAQFVVNRCFAGETVYCGQITRNGAGIITGITLQPFNTRSEISRGIDIETSYRSNFAGGQIELRGLVNYVDRLAIISTANTIERAGEVGNNVGAAEGVPRWRALASATYTQGPITTQLRGRFIGASKQDQQWGPLDISRNDVPAIFYLDAYLGFRVTGSAGSRSGEFFLAGDNLLNTAPPVVTAQDNSNVLSLGTNPLVYDVIGTALRAGFRFSF